MDLREAHQAKDMEGRFCAALGLGQVRRSTEYGMLVIPCLLHVHSAVRTSPPINLHRQNAIVCDWQ